MGVYNLNFDMTQIKYYKPRPLVSYHIKSVLYPKDPSKGFNFNPENTSATCQFNLK